MGSGNHHFKVGSLDCIVVSDGTFAYPHPAAIFFANAPKEQLTAALRKHDFDPERWEEYVSPYLCLVVNTDEHLILVDTGAGEFVPTTGKLIPNLQVAGIEPEDIDMVILTHGHPDHIGGVLDSDGKLAFPNARYVMWKDEWDFWISEPDLTRLQINEELRQVLLTFAQNCLQPIRGQLHLVDGETDVIQGVRALPAPGHTPGHMALAISSGGEQLLCSSDLMILPITLEHPEWCAAVDFDHKQTVATRKRFFSRAAEEESLVFAFHFPFPGLGHIVQKGNAWQWQPI